MSTISRRLFPGWFANVGSDDTIAGAPIKIIFRRLTAKPDCGFVAAPTESTGVFAQAPFGTLDRSLHLQIKRSRRLASLRRRVL
jgi:hypothetical protein